MGRRAEKAPWTTAGRKSADTDLDACEVDIDALLSRDQPLFGLDQAAPGLDQAGAAIARRYFGFSAGPPCGAGRGRRGNWPS